MTDSSDLEDGKGDSPSLCLPLGVTTQAILDDLRTLWGTEPQFVCNYEQPVFQTACGQVLPNNAGYCPADDSIAMDGAFLASAHEKHGWFAPVVILAHEWGHMNQIKAGVPLATSKAKELHADCQAGVFTAAYQLIHGELDLGAVDQAFAALCSGAAADDTWWNSELHGTCGQRTTAFASGYQGGLANPGALSAAPFETMLALCAQ